MREFKMFVILDGDNNLMVHKVFTSLGRAVEWLSENAGPDWSDYDYNIIKLEIAE